MPSERPRSAQERGENIRVICRFRPLNERELALERSGGKTAVRFGEGGRTVWVGPDEGSGQYALDAVLPPSATQHDVYVETTSIVDAVMKGYNGTLLAYGQVCALRKHSLPADPY